MAAVDFSDLDAAEKWFAEQTVETRCVIASRAALRVLATIGLFASDRKERVALAALRAALISVGRGLGRPADVVKLENAALSAGTRPALSAASALSSAASTARSAATAVSAAHSFSVFSPLSAASASAVFATALSAGARPASSSASSVVRAAATLDARQDNATLRTLPLWHGVDVPDEILSAHDTWCAYLSSDPAWAFWLRWYSEMWEGTFEDWDLAIEVAKLPDALWEGDDALHKVADAIPEIEARLLKSRLPQIEDVFEDDSGLYNVRTVFADPVKLIASIDQRVRFALDLAIHSNACDLNEMSLAAKVLRHALDNCQNDPNALEQYLRQAAAMIRARIAEGQFGADDALDLLVATLEELALQLRADHPEVAAAVDARIKQTLNELSKAKRLQAVGLIEDVREGTTARLHAELGLASETVRENAVPEVTAEAVKRSGNQAAKISLAERAKKAESSGAMSGVKIGMRAQKLVEFVTELFSGGGGSVRVWSPCVEGVITPDVVSAVPKPMHV
ncbi:hypothetical protein [Tateyamaria sp. SN6-1]|uniref:hypothetical protein n=1 Tax=Tateyamaria sp. SN6-1 TaxID=3092148 RepID=UPI0039F54DEF